VIGGDMLGEGVGAGKSGLRAAVLYRPDADWTARPASGATLEEIFAMRYRLCTAAEIAAEAAREMADAGGSHSDAEPAPVPTPKLPKD